jgi:4-hydroxy-tetrahydrodipicolinate synthase
LGSVFAGCYTAIVTPLTGENGAEVDYAGLRRLVDFQIAAGVDGILAVGTTGESPTLTWDEHGSVIARTAEYAEDRCTVIAGTGSNSTAECIEHTADAVEHGIRTVLLVEPYYNGPSSIEIRREYMAPVAHRFPEVQVIPYVIPGRTGTQLLPEDLALLKDECPNVTAVKEASANEQNMRRTREVCGPDFAILSGDDELTFSMMTDPDIAACGAVSVVSNVAPSAVTCMTHAVLDGNADEGGKIAQALQPLLEVVTVRTQEPSAYGTRLCKARNPLPIKTLMRVLGMPAGPVRSPLGKMTPAGLESVLAAARAVWKKNPEILEPVGEAFDVDVGDRLFNLDYCRGLCEEP